MGPRQRTGPAGYFDADIGGRERCSVIGAVLGAFVTFFVVLVGLPPSPDDLTNDAAALVLPESDPLDAGANTGATIIVGWERFTCPFRSRPACSTG